MGRKTDIGDRITFRVSEQRVLSLNGIADRNRIYPGQNLQLPGFEARSVSDANGPDRPAAPEGEQGGPEEELARAAEKEVLVATRSPQAQAGFGRRSSNPRAGSGSR